MVRRQDLASHVLLRVPPEPGVSRRHADTMWEEVSFQELTSYQGHSLWPGGCLPTGRSWSFLSAGRELWGTWAGPRLLSREVRGPRPSIAHPCIHSTQQPNIPSQTDTHRTGKVTMVLMATSPSGGINTFF